MRRKDVLIVMALLAITTTLLLQLAPLGAQSGFGTGWTATYFNCPALSATTPDLNTCTQVTSQPVAAVNFDYAAGSPTAGVNPDNFYIRFDSVQNLLPGTYEFVAASDDGIRVTINGQVVIDQLIGRVLTTDRSQPIPIAGGAVTMRVDFIDLIDRAQVQFQWFQQTSGTPVPGATNPFAVLGTGTPVGTPSGPSVSVRGVNGLAVRTGPYIGASMVTTAVSGTSYAVTARNNSEGFNWYYINVNGRQGWASGRYLTLNNITPDALPTQATIFDQIDGAPDLGIIGAPRAVMNVRPRPTTRLDEIDEIAWGEEVSIIGRTVQAGTNRWYHIRTSEGLVGWILAAYVQVGPEVVGAPVR